MSRSLSLSTFVVEINTSVVTFVARFSVPVSVTVDYFNLTHYLSTASSHIRFLSMCPGSLCLCGVQNSVGSFVLPQAQMVVEIKKVSLVLLSCGSSSMKRFRRTEVLLFPPIFEECFQIRICMAMAWVS